VWNVRLTPGGERTVERSSGWIWRRETLQVAVLPERLPFWLKNKGDKKEQKRLRKRGEQNRTRQRREGEEGGRRAHPSSPKTPHKAERNLTRRWLFKKNLELLF
jgi:hypothetical protein